MSSIKGKLLSIYIFLIFLISVVALVSIFNLHSLNKAIDGLIASNYKSIISAKNMIDSIERQDSYELIFIRVEEESGIKEFYDNQVQFITWLTKSRDNITEADEKDVIETITKQYKEYTDAFHELLKIKNTQGEKEAGNYYSKEIYPIFLDIKEACGKLVEINETAMFNRKDRATISSRNQTYGTAILSGFAITAGLFFSVFFTRRIVRPIHSLITGIKSIKEGNLNHELEVSTRDEIGELALEFNNMSKRLSLYEKSNVKNLILERNKSMAIVRSIKDPIIVTDNDYRILLVNKSAEDVFDIYEQRCLGRHILESINNDEIFGRIKKSLKGSHDEKKGDIITIKGNDKPYYYIITVTSIRDNDEESYGTVTVLQDITRLKEMDQMKSDFVSTISHELRTPLTSIIMGTELLLNNSTGVLNSEQNEIVSAVDEDSKKLMDLVNDLLHLSKIESGKIELHYEDVSLGDTIKAIAKSLKEIADDRKVSIHYDIPEDIPLIKGDYNKIASIVSNLVTNALKFTEDGDEIKISAAVEDGFVKVCVIDTGIGIPEEYHDKIFDKFTQVQQSSFISGGTGLGLAIAKEYVNKHGGEIWVESKPGDGSRFTFTLPV